MNTAQRKFLIDQIEEQRKQQVQDLREKMPEAPNLANYLFHSIMKGTLQLKTHEEILEAIKKKALSAKPDQNWLKAEGRRYYGDDDEHKPTIELTIGSIIVIPDEYRELWDKYKAKKKMIEGAIEAVNVQAKTLTTRITLASNNVLARLIAEVDDMGDLSFMDESLKLISKVDANTQKLLGRNRDDD